MTGKGCFGLFLLKHINPDISCKNSGIYGITCKCVDQYAGKTTVTNAGRFKEHWSKDTSVRAHLRSCPSKPTVKDTKVQFLENVWGRGKYTLSEREYLWNKRLKGNINIQKTISRWISECLNFLVQFWCYIFCQSLINLIFIFQLMMLPDIKGWLRNMSRKK